MIPPSHKCGIGAAANTPTPFHDLFCQAISIQNRGYDGCCFSLFDLDTNTVRTYRGSSKVADTFSHSLEATEIKSTAGIFGNRYRTAGDTNSHNLPPIIAGGFAVSHNGNVLNAGKIAARHGIKVGGYDSDTKVIAEIIRQAGDIEKGIETLAHEAIGAYNLAIMGRDGEIGVYRDPWGFHPLFMGKKNGATYFASEEPSLWALDIYDTEEMNPGDLWLIDGNNEKKTSIKPTHTDSGVEIVKSACPFELSYFMRPGGNFDGKSTPKFREDVGGRLARLDGFEPYNYIVTPIPNSGRRYATGYSAASGVPLRDCFLVNTDMNRLYMEEDKMSALGITPEKLATLKNMAIPETVKGERVIVADDSIVRASTLYMQIEKLFNAGAKESHLRIGTPPILWPCHMGLNHSDRKKLKAAKATAGIENPTLKEIEEGVRKSLDPRLTSLRYLPVEDYKELLKDRGDHCLGCFTGRYPFPMEELY